MATITILTDDLDGSPDAQPFTFALDGAAYEIDLSPTNLEGLRESLAPFIHAARRVASTSAGLPRKRSSAGGRREGYEQRSAIREWAISEGLMRPEARGRIPALVVHAYEEAHQ